ncbi:type VI secretion system protein TssL, long form [Azospirillum sp. YIM B02556]|uniref:Type VI secretion system protein TssL, long form n=1 Tax=Azospirillum endophyticum TaxID=2800326 RepID=A0ABS1F6Z1_9PROT|nr:type VI secretion system protein TssL, long form [Azospirillum endophyticum]MBK1839042.1 type VI secretion system protein TssL, long form [Azospirillum endophyticum]
MEGGDEFGGKPGPETERTVLMPTPGGRRSAASGGSAGGDPSAPRVEAVGVPGPALAGIFAARSPLAAAASPVLLLAARLNDVTEVPDLESLRQRVISALRDFQHWVTKSGLDSATQATAHYALCALIDDIVLNSPWGSQSSWTRQNVTSMFHKNVVGGDQFYDRLASARQDPGKYGDLLELMYLCLSLGFRGRYRVAGRQDSEHARIREDVYNILVKHRGYADRILCPNAAALAMDYRPPRSSLPVWVTGAGTALFLLLLFLGLSFLLNGASDRLFAGMGGLPPHGGVVIETPPPVKLAEAAPPPPQIAPPPPPQTTQVQRVRKFLEPEIAEGLVEVTEDALSVTVRMRGNNLFASGSASLNDKVRASVLRVGRAVAEEPGAVLITGHTDNVPMTGGGRLRFPSNWHLSKARAESVMAEFDPLFADKSRMKAEGKADTEPVAPNDTAEGRAANRRIDIILKK